MATVSSKAPATTSSCMVPQMFALPVRGPVTNQKLTVQYQICKKLFWTREGKSECAYVPATPDEMKAVAGVSNVFTAININTGQKMAVRIPLPPSKPAPAQDKTQDTTAQSPHPPLIRNVISVNDVQNAAAKSKGMAVKTSAAPGTLQLQMSPQVANTPQNIVGLDSLQFLKLSTDKSNTAVLGQAVATTIKTITTAQTSNVISQLPKPLPSTIVVGGAHSTGIGTKTLPTQQQKILLGNLVSTGTGSTSLSQQPIIFTLAPGVCSTTASKSTSVYQVTGQASQAGKPIQLILSPGTGPRNITITVPQTTQGKPGTSHISKPLPQRIGGTQILQTDPKVSAVLPMQRISSSGRTGVKSLEPVKTTLGNFVSSSVSTKIACVTPTSTTATPPKTVSAIGMVNANVAKVNPVVPVSISVVPQESKPRDVIKEDPKPKECESGLDEKQQVCNTGSDNSPMFKIDSVFSLSGASAQELFPEESKINIKTEKLEPETDFLPGTGSTKSEGHSQFDVCPIRVKEEPPDTGYEKALSATVPDAHLKTPTTTTAKVSTNVASAIVNKCANIIASNEQILSTSSLNTPRSVVRPVRENVSSPKQYVIVTKQDIIPPTPSAITIEKPTSPNTNTMLVTPASPSRKPGEPMKWTVVAPPPQPAREQSPLPPATSASEKTIVVHPPGTAMKATKTGVSTYLVKNPSGETTILQFKSAAEKLGEIACMAGDVTGKPAKVVFTSKSNTETSTSSNTVCRAGPSAPAVKGHEYATNSSTKVKSEKVEKKIFEVTKPLSSVNFTKLNPTVSLLKVTTPLTTTPTLSTPTSKPGTVAATSSAPTSSSTVAPSRTTRQSAKAAQERNSEIMTRKRKQDLRALAETHLTDIDNEITSSTESPAKRPKESVQDERIRKLKELLKEREAALEQIRQTRQKAKFSGDEDNASC